MFIGHYAVALGAKPAAPRLSLGVLVLAACWMDFVWLALIALRVEHVAIQPGITVVNPLSLYDYPWSHSLLLSVLWGMALALLVYALVRDWRAAWVVAVLVLSHWILDFVSHAPDMPLAPGSPARVGLGLWNSRIGTAAVEGGLFALGAAIYLRTTRARDALGRWPLWLLLLLLGLSWANAIRPGAPPPPSVRMLVPVSAVFSLLVLAWFTWVDRHRDARPARN